MSWTMAGIRSGLSTRLSGVGVTVYDTWPSVPTIPAALIGLASENPVDYDDSYDEAATLRLVVTVLVQKVVDQVAQTSADTFINPTGATSIRAALNATRSAGVWDYVVVRGAARYGQYEFGATETALRYLGVEFNLDVGVS